MRRLFLFFCFAIHTNLYAQNLTTYVNVRVLSNVKLTAIQLEPYQGLYLFYLDSIKQNFNAPFISLKIAANNDSIVIIDKDNKKYLAKKLICKPIGILNDLNIKPTEPILYSRNYDDEITISAQKNSLFILNKSNIEFYVNNVIAAEVGTKAHAEYYKTQAILSRTYALANMRKHELEGFNVCDQVHCQVMAGNNKVNEEIKKATKYTQNQVLISDVGELAQTAFHSNCGGQTINCEDIWNIKKSYLISINDTFCLHESSAKWEKKISFTQWKKYLLKNKSIKDSVLDISNYKQPERKKYFSLQPEITLKQIRLDFNLKSTFFEIVKQDSNIVFKGKGFGHGVGLCQQGAMRMAVKGYGYRNILNFYYYNLKIINYNNWSFFIE